AEDGIRDKLVTGVQTCALPIFQYEGSKATRDDRFDVGPDVEVVARFWIARVALAGDATGGARGGAGSGYFPLRRSGRPNRRRTKIGRASCRERGENSVIAADLE